MVRYITQFDSRDKLDITCLVFYEREFLRIDTFTPRSKLCHYTGWEQLARTFDGKLQSFKLELIYE